MKEIKSIYGLLSNHTIAYILVIIMVLGLIQGGLFFTLGINQAQVLAPFHVWIDHFIVKYSFLLAIMIITILTRSIVVQGNASLTIKRLGISNRRLFLVWTLYTFIVMTILWASQVLIILLASKYYIYVTPENMTMMQTTYLSNFRSNFFHLLLPLHDIGKCICYCFILLCLSCGCGSYAVSKINGNNYRLADLSFCLFLYFSIDYGAQSLFLLFFLLFLLAVYIHGGIYHET